jgi:hypothetical protein
MDSSEDHEVQPGQDLGMLTGGFAFYRIADPQVALHLSPLPPGAQQIREPLYGTACVFQRGFDQSS